MRPVQLFKRSLPKKWLLLNVKHNYVDIDFDIRNNMPLAQMPLPFTPLPFTFTSKGALFQVVFVRLSRITGPMEIINFDIVWNSKRLFSNSCLGLSFPLRHIFCNILSCLMLSGQRNILQNTFSIWNDMLDRWPAETYWETRRFFGKFLLVS